MWNQNFKDYFVETILLNYPCPAIFLYEEITPEGKSIYNVVDGKQRLRTIFEFIQNEFPVYEKSQIPELRGLYFQNLDPEKRKKFFSYTFLVEYLPETKQDILNNIFDRINRNVAKLTPQELRHARLDGEYISVVEELSSLIEEELPSGVPRFNKQAKKQMKDDQLVATLLLLIEEGPKGYSQEDLDRAFTERDISWENRSKIEKMFRSVISKLKDIFLYKLDSTDLSKSRMRNQADFYSLFGAVLDLYNEENLPDIAVIVERLKLFIDKVESEDRDRLPKVSDYYEATRSASNDKGPRMKRIDIIKNVIMGNI